MSLEVTHRHGDYPAPSTASHPALDDFAPLRALLRQILDAYSAFLLVGEAEDGKAAIEFAIALAPHVVIMDVDMSRLGGIEATRRIKRILPTVHGIGLSLNDDPNTQDVMRAAGSSAFLSKKYHPPIDLSPELQADHLSRKSFRNSSVLVDSYLRPGHLPRTFVRATPA
jgi:DNA-binding NarL/FixJ family response regulator